MPLDQIIPVLQLAIAPVILISGVGLVLLSMTNRYGRVIDRSRILSDKFEQAGAEKSERTRRQLQILARRAGLLRAAILLTTLSILLVALLIIILFATALSGMGGTTLIITIFCFCMLSLIGGLVLFLVDVNVSLAALSLEKEVWDAKPGKAKIP